MTHAYLTGIHQYLAKTIRTFTQKQEKALAANDPIAAAQWGGAHQELTELRKYVSEHFDLSTDRYPDP